MPSPMSANLIDVPASIVLTFAASPLSPPQPKRWAWAAAAVAVLGLLIGFYVVVRQIEQQGERRRQAVLAHADATWRCNALRGRPQRSSCLAQLNTLAAPVQVEQVLLSSNQR